MAQLGSRCRIERAAVLADHKDQSDVGVLCKRSFTLAEYRTWTASPMPGRR